MREGREELSFQKSDSAEQRRNRALRFAILGVVLSFSTFLGLMHQMSRGWVPAGVDAFCPFGGIESAYALISTGTMLKRIAWSSFILLGAVLITAVLFRRSFCGSLCPLGTLQELFGRLGKKLLKRRLPIHRSVDRPARLLKYVVLLLTVGGTAVTAKLVIRPYDPWATYHHLFSADLFSEFPIGFTVLTLSLLGSLFSDRVFCKYLCPMGGFLGMVHRGGVFRVRRNDDTCIHCSACSRVCPVDIEIESMLQVHSAECILCGECVNVCPVRDTLFIGGSKRARMRHSTLLLVTLAIFIATVGGTTVIGAFEWELKTLAETVQKSGGFNPEEIRGRDSFKEVSEASGVSKKSLMKQFDLSEEEFGRPIKDVAMEREYQFDTEDVRQFISEKLKE
jgi:polyferredoxin